MTDKNRDLIKQFEQQYGLKYTGLVVFETIIGHQVVEWTGFMQNTISSATLQLLGNSKLHFRVNQEGKWETLNLERWD